MALQHSMTIPCSYASINSSSRSTFHCAWKNSRWQCVMKALAGSLPPECSATKSLNSGGTYMNNKARSSHSNFLSSLIKDPPSENIQYGCRDGRWVCIGDTLIRFRSTCSTATKQQFRIAQEEYCPSRTWGQSQRVAESIQAPLPPSGVPCVLS